MMTVKQIQRRWNDKQVSRLSAELLACRPDVPGSLHRQLVDPAAVAALAVIRLDELGQAYTETCAQLLRHLLATQDPQGGWGDVLHTALALRALLTSRGHGPAVQRAVEYLAQLQKTEGVWPNHPLRRMPADPLVSALLLLHLAREESFCQRVDFDLAMRWFAQHPDQLDSETRRLLNWLELRYRPAAATHN